MHDSSGAGIPAATVVLHNNATNIDTNSSTNGTGEYAIVNIAPGAYTLRVSKTGFQSAQQNDVSLSVNQTASYDFTLPVGSAEQTVTVTAAAPTIESSTAELGAVISTASVNDLPLNGRNFTQLLQLTPGASPVNTAQTFGFRGVGVRTFHRSTARAIGRTCFWWMASTIRLPSPAITPCRPSWTTFRSSRWMPTTTRCSSAV